MGIFSNLAAGLSGKIVVINRLGNETFAGFQHRLDNINPSNLPISKRSKEERLIWLAQQFTSQTISFLFLPSDGHFLKNISKVSDSDFFQLYTTFVLYFLRVFYKNDAFLNQIINHTTLIDYLNKTYVIIDEQLYNKFNKMLDLATNGNEAGVLFDFICKYTHTDSSLYGLQYLGECVKKSFVLITLDDRSILINN